MRIFERGNYWGMSLMCHCSKSMPSATHRPAVKKNEMDGGCGSQDLKVGSDFCMKFIGCERSFRIQLVTTLKIQGAFSSQKIWLEIFTTLIRNIKYRLIIKLITRMDRKSRDESLLNLINSSLEIVYYSTILSNHCIIRFIRFVSRFCPGVMEWVLSVIYI